MSADLILICWGCRKPIEGDTGSLRVTYAAIHDARAAQAEWARRQASKPIRAADVKLAPEAVHWLAYHDRCDPAADQDCYQIDAIRLCGWRDLTEWTAHLMVKNWFALTDWDDLLSEAAAGSGDTIRLLERQP